MVRQTQHPRARSPDKSSMRAASKIPLNDDREEKAVRFQSRHALHERQMNEIKASVHSPVRKRRSRGSNGGADSSIGDDKENDGGLTPIKRVPILANFEEWMKMATDNKINATNSWNFALIDYFHDMSLLREGDSVNFQKASCTLDGCVKIYTSRVDNVATETGKLLSGLADGSNRKGEDDQDGDGADGDEDEEGEDGQKKKAKRRTQRSEATLATSFAQLQLKKMELEFSVDPLFKKASADFDEGGAKGLLLNHLTIDPEGRIVFDSSDDTQEESLQTSEDAPSSQSAETAESKSQAAEPETDHDVDIDVEALGLRFFPDLAKLDEQDVCPSMKTFELEGAQGSLDIPFLKASEDWKKDASQDPETRDEVPAFDDDNGMDMGGFDMAGDVGFGEGGEAWAREAAVSSQPNVDMGFDYNGDGEDSPDGDVGHYDPHSAHYGVTLQKSSDQDNILAYFDQALSKNWAGPEHWRIRKIKDANKPAPAPRQRKEKEAFEIDFAAPMTSALADAIYTPAATNSAISLPKSQWKSKSRNLLPDDKHFSSKSLLSLFLKPKARIGARRGRAPGRDPNNGEMDGAFWAQRNQEAADAMAAEEDVKGDYDANFFQDDGLGLPPLPDDDDDEFADAQEHLPPALGDIDGGLSMGQEPEGGYGTNLVTQSRRLRPEYVQYARVAKKVDVRRLKEEMWRGIDVDPLKAPSAVASTPAVKTEEGIMKFTDVMNSLQTVYPKQAMADISTSYCFICLLHLANEKGLELAHDEGFDEIRIRKDETAIIGEGDF